MYFAKDMLEAKKALEAMGHIVYVPKTAKKCVSNPHLNIDFKFVLENNCMMDHFNKIKKSDAILVINKRRQGHDGYIGGSTLMEIAVAKFLGKTIFILNKLPSENKISYIFEVKVAQPIILNGDLSKIFSLSPESLAKEESPYEE
ncbi:hypothetical protein COV49_02860 [Candidatus Falkowbacteria bacterium CG11_big_fil_rev_8_21_14_0_20_39_10]|uniref:Uncharacterized protein n=1 Tax=Candidatus Falkowbacteria bacterium CG11_big_fil_rev_8_21_14_0_20_39_10 TaxID=1974570 RepID=A0A2M6K8R1_9BACT|nr:MAG: hypothetical protein COV49_02860 [Candidatus Falkowbacteria bacterium CG11_big_fil_rev_8_21_14_0_20_39_10]